MEGSDSDRIKLYKLYWSLCLTDILYYLGYEPTTENKLVLHEFHKRVLGYKTISDRPIDVLSRFIAEMTIFWAEHGIFVRTSGKQPVGIQDMDLFDIYKGKRIWDLL
jgi:hypothetical protein